MPRSAHIEPEYSSSVTLTLHVEEVHSAAQSLEQSHVDEYPCCMVFDVARILGTVVRVVPVKKHHYRL